MYPQIIDTVNRVEALVSSLLSLIFCVLALFVLVYYIRRRYKLYREIHRIPQELLIMETYRNHLKNLRLICIINNFIIVILVLEFVQNMGQFAIYFPYFIIYFVKETGFSIPFLLTVEKYSSLFTIPIYYSLVPLLSMFMDFLWLAYRKYEYKYAIMKWTWYIVVRTLIAFLVQYSLSFNISPNYQTIYSDLGNAFYGLLRIIDFIQYIYYARKFYLHLKSREKEIRLFYNDKNAYLESKNLRIHFKIATILVGISLIFFTLAVSDRLFTIFQDIPYYIAIPQQLKPILLVVYNIYVDFICIFSFFIFQILSIFNYLYIISSVVYKSYKNNQKLKNINKYIKPIIDQHHESYYNRCHNYYA